MEVIFEKIIDDALFKKDSWFKKFLRRVKCKCQCCMGSSCSIEPEDILEEKKKQKEEFMEFIKSMKSDFVKKKESINSENNNLNVVSI